MDETQILLIEDDLVLSKAIQTGLATTGFQVRAASTYSEGIDMIRDKVPEVLVLDIELPDGSGWDILTYLHDSRPTSIPIILVTTSTHVPRARIREYDISRHIPKPFDINHLVETVCELLPSRESSQPMHLREGKQSSI